MRWSHTYRTLQSIQHERQNVLILTRIQFSLRADLPEAIIDDGQEHAHAHKHHQKNEQGEGERAEKRCRLTQLLRIEFHQHHLEQHLRGVQQRRTGPQFAGEQQVEEREECPEDDREHGHERQQIFGRMLKRLEEEHQALIEASETDELECGQETAQSEETSEQIGDIHGQLQVDIGVAIGLCEEITDTIGLTIAPHVDAHIGPRTHDDRHVDVRPQLTEIVSLQPNQRLHFDHHHVDNAYQVQDAGDQMRRRCENYGRKGK